MKSIEQIGDKAKKIYYRMNMKIKVRREAARCTNCGKINEFYYLSDFSYGERLVLFHNGMSYAYINLLKDDVYNDDPLYNDIVEFVISTRKASASLLQRRFKLGYNRAARIIDLLEERGIIGPANGSKPREVLVDNDEEDEE